MERGPVAPRVRTAISWRLSRLRRLPSDWWAAARKFPPHRRSTRFGIDWELSLHDNTQNMLYREGSYEPNLLDLILRTLSEGDVYVDIGAHIGIHALPAARRLQGLGGHVYAFEPSDSADELERAARRNGIVNLTLVRCAVGETAGTVELRPDPRFGRDDPATRSAFGPGPVIGSFPVVVFDAWAKDLERLDVVKIDIEGSEVSALIGMRETLARLRPRLVIVEDNEETLARAGRSSQDLRDELARTGYQARDRIVDHGVAMNVAFVPDR